MKVVGLCYFSLFHKDILLLEQNPAQPGALETRNQSFSMYKFSDFWAPTVVQDFVHELKVGSRAKEVGARICELGSTPSGCKRGLFLLGFFRSLKNMSGHNKMHPFFCIATWGYCNYKL